MSFKNRPSGFAARTAAARRVITGGDPSAVWVPVTAVADGAVAAALANAVASGAAAETAGGGFSAARRWERARSNAAFRTSMKREGVRRVMAHTSFSAGERTSTKGMPRMSMTPLQGAMRGAAGNGTGSVGSGSGEEGWLAPSPVLSGGCSSANATHRLGASEDTSGGRGANASAPESRSARRRSYSSAAARVTMPLLRYSVSLRIRWLMFQ
mmetsp:Transcript_9831/g.24709  ORF Transcript_9831/g.24709 Transcript_9831/m.24709 type:complete len:212 (-) Transcript_9831:910-1545(-)